MDYGNGGGSDDLSSYDLDPGSDSSDGYDLDFGDPSDYANYGDYDSFAAPAQVGTPAPPAAKPGILERILGKDLGATFKNNPTMMIMALGFIVVLMYVFFKSGRGGGGGTKKRRRGGRRKKKGILNL